MRPVPPALMGDRWTAARLEHTFGLLVSPEHVRPPHEMSMPTAAAVTALVASTKAGVMDTEYWCISQKAINKCPVAALEYWGIEDPEQAEHPVLGGRKILSEISLRVIDLPSGETESSSCWSDYDVGLSETQLKEYQQQVTKIAAAGIMLHNFSKGPDARCIEWGTGQPYDLVARDFREMEVGVTKLFQRRKMPCTMDVHRAPG